MLSETTKLLRDLVAIASINPMGRDLKGPEYLETRLSAYLETFFRDQGIAATRQKTAAPERDNIVARFDAPGARHTLLLEVHQDTVPVDGMTIDPFGATIAGGRLYGRGACDIKGGMAAMLAAVARLGRERPAGAMNVILACTVDEEFTFLGVQELVKQGVRADFAVVAEPTGLNVVHAHKGVARFILTTTGRACHSSQPELGVNAVYRMGHVLVGIERFADKLRNGRADPLLGPPTMSVGRIQGGVSVNTVPDVCRIEIDRRVIPGEDAEATGAQLATFLREEAKIDFDFECSRLLKCTPALDPKGADEIIQRLGRAADTVLGSHKVMPVAYGTDASTIARGGIPAVVFGPGDIAQAHTKDEWVSLEEVEKASEILYQLATHDGE
jgi:acetylornithine deacetylase ArgE